MPGAELMEWFARVEWLRIDLLARLLLAALLGGAIGLEREASGKPAGFRTNLLICVGAALLTELSIFVARGPGGGSATADPGRIAAQIVSGIGFLGAGTILQARGSVVGLTTAATLWVVAAIGMAVGARAYVEAIGTTVLVLTALLLLGRIEPLLTGRRAERFLEITFAPDPAALGRVLGVLERGGLRPRVIEVEREPDAIRALLLVTGPRKRWITANEALLEVEGVRRVGLSTTA